MKLVLTSLVAVFVATAAQAACYGDYKAKRDGPLRLHYGVLQLSDAACSDVGRATDEARARVEANGWQFLNLVSTFGEGGLAQRRDSAGDFYLRF